MMPDTRKRTDQIFPDAFKKMVDDATKKLSNAPTNKQVKTYQPPSRGANNGQDTPPYDSDGDADGD